MGSGTKAKILDSALRIFARDGYAGTNIKDIAESVGIVKSALYRHFDSKEAIWNAVFEMMISYYGEHIASAADLQHVPQSTDELYEMTMRMVDFTVHDEKVILTRKILLTEQFRDDRVRALATGYFLDDIEAVFEKVFASMMDAGVIRKADAKLLALSYTSPITSLIHLCDREPDRIPEAVGRIESFIRQFTDTYGAEI